MRGLRGFLGGVLGLIVLEIVVTNRQASGRVGGIFSGIAAATSWFVDAGVPGIPDRTGKSATSSAPQTLPQALIAPPAIGTTTPAYASTSLN